MPIHITTNKLVLGATIMVGLITMVGLLSLVVIAFEDLSTLHAWRIESILGSIVLGGLGYLGYMLKKFMDTRSNQEKDKHKEKMRYEKFKYKLDKYKLKIQKDNPL